MPRRISHALLSLAAGVGLGLSALLLWEYAADGAGLCAAGGGCDEVRHSALSFVAGIPLPVFGALYFATVGVLAALGGRARELLWAFAIAGGIGGAALLSIQAFSIGAFCSFCVAVDVSAMSIPMSLWLGRRGDQLPGRARLFGGAFAASAAGLIAFFGVVMAEPTAPPVAADAPLPAVVAAEQREGVVTIVEFVDFSCPHCRRLHHSLSDAIESYGDRVRIVRKQVPLPIHEFSVDAARAACCGEDAGVGEAMADRLFSADDLSDRGCAEIARELGLDSEQFAACTGSDDVRERIRTDVAAAKSAEVRGLPTFYIGNQRFEGYRSPAELRAAIDRALRSDV